MALATLHLAAIPVFAGLLAGTGAVATFVTGADRPAAPVAITATSAEPERPCVAQTWPYIDQKCMASAANPDKPVRLVVAPRANEPVENSEQSATAPAAAPTGLMTRDTVLRAPEYLEPKQGAPEARARSEQRRAKPRKSERRWAAQSYSVPGAKPVIVVRPLRLDAFR